MTITTKEQLRSAFIAAFDKKARRDTCVSLFERTRPSPEHTERMNAMLGITEATPVRLYRLTPRRILLIVLILIITAALAGCAVVGFNMIGAEENDEYNSVYVSLDTVNYETAPLSIERAYAPGFVPEGYAVAQEIMDWASVNIHYKNESNEWISYCQYTLDSAEVRVDNEHGEFSRLISNSIEYYIHTGERTTSYFWTDGEYFFILQTPSRFSATEDFEIIDGIRFVMEIE